jgi:hypothetical protein
MQAAASAPDGGRQCALTSGLPNVLRPAEPATTGARPAELAPQPARPNAQAQKEGATPALPPAPAEKTAPPIKER